MKSATRFWRSAHATGVLLGLVLERTDDLKVFGCTQGQIILTDIFMSCGTAKLLSTGATVRSETETEHANLNG